MFLSINIYSINFKLLLNVNKINKDEYKFSLSIEFSLNLEIYWLIIFYGLINYDVNFNI